MEVDRDIGENVSYSEMSGSSSVVECNLAKVDVAGSNPVSRSILILLRAGPLAQLVEQETLNLKVAGSTPARPTILNRFTPTTYQYSCWVFFFVGMLLKSTKR